MKLKIVQQTDALTHVALSGRLDTAGVLDVEKLFLDTVAEAGKPAIVDLAQVTFIASMGMRMLIACAQTLGRTKAELVLLNPQPAVDGALRLVGLTDAMHVVRNEQEAMSFLNRDKTNHAAF